MKNELGWADFRVTDYTSIERWWEVVFSAYLLVTWHTNDFQNKVQPNNTQTTSTSTSAMPFEQHIHWEAGINCQSALNNLRLRTCAVHFLVLT